MPPNQGVVLYTQLNSPEPLSIAVNQMCIKWLAITTDLGAINLRQFKIPGGLFFVSIVGALSSLLLLASATETSSERLFIWMTIEKNNGNSGNENRGIIDFREEEENHK
ncbi:12546_t:CDS:2 [Entrophospora sp. SA101]|nr:12546_t:CDS:2 [Entrophospora sp. SA101]